MRVNFNIRIFIEQGENIMCELNAVISRIKECTTIGELEFIEDTFKSGFFGTDKVDFMTAWLERYYELKRG